MRKLLYLTLLILLSPLAALANQNVQGWCESGAQPVVTSGLTSSTQVQASYPTCTVTVFVHGGGLAAIFSDNSGTPLANPFTAQTNGRWLWYAANGRYDVQLSGAGFPSPVTYSDISLSDPANQQAAVPCTTLSFSATPAFLATNNICYNMTLTGNITSSTITGTPANGNILLLNFTQDAIGGRSFVFPANFIIPAGTIFSTAATTTNYLAFKFDGTNWSFFTNTGTGTGGSPAIGTLGTVQTSNGTGAFAASGAKDDGTNFTLDRDFHPKGPNPYVDATRYNVRAIATNAIPAIPGITANCVSGLSTVLVSPTVNGLQNNDGVVLLGCGSAHSMTTPSAPTVTPSNTSSSMGTGLTVAGAAGATTYNYKFIACDKAGGCTAASATGSTTTGQATLGNKSVAITSISKSGLLNTVTTSAAHNLTAGSKVTIFSTTDDKDFGGVFIVNSVADNTHFVYSNGFDSNNGAGTTATGGTATWEQANHVSVPAVTGAFHYGVYSDRGGAGFQLVCVSRPQNVSVGQGIDPTCDDFGSPIMDGLLAPYYMPTTAPVSATSDSLVTTISSGAGTATLTLANSAGTTVSGATILFTDGPNIVTAANASANTGGSMMFPMPAVGTSYVINSYTVIPGGTAMMFSGSWFLNDTVELGSYTKLYGDRLPQWGIPQQFGFEGNPGIAVSHANPGIYIPSFNGNLFSAMNFPWSANNALPIFTENGFQSTMEWVNFQSASTTDYMSIGLYMRGNSPGASDFFHSFKTVAFLSQQGLTTSAPLFYCTFCGFTQMENLSFSGRAMAFDAVGEVHVKGGRAQGIGTPLLTFRSGIIDVRNFNLDTSALSLIVDLSGTTSFDGNIITVTDAGFPSFNGVGVLPNVSGSPAGSVITIGLGGVVQNTHSISVLHTGLGGGGPGVAAYGNTNDIAGFGASNVGHGIAQPPAPSVVLGGVGSCVSNCVAAGTFLYAITAQDIYGNESVLSPPTSITTDGTKTVTVSWTLVAGQVQTRPFRGIVANNLLSGFNPTFGLTGTSYIDGTNAPPGGAFYTSSALQLGAMNASAGSQGVAGQQLTLTNSNFKDVHNEAGLTANITTTWPNISGTVAKLSAAQIWLDNQSIANGKELRFFSNDLTHWAGFKGGASVVNLVWLFPTTDSTGTQCLSSNGSLQLAWSPCSAGTGTPGGANTQLQFNNTGTFGGSANLTWVSPVLTIGVAGSTTGQLAMTGSASGTVTVTPQATAGSPTLTWPNTSGTFAVGASAPLVLSATTGNLTCPTCTTNAAAATANQLMIGGGAQAIAALGTLGTATTVLHGNASGAPAFAAVNLATETTGVAAIVNGGTGQSTASAAFNALSPITTTGDIIIGTGANAAGRLAIGGNGLCLISNGTTLGYGSCAAGAVGGNGVSGQGTFWNGAASIAGSANWTYAAASGHSLTQGANAADALYMKRFTDTTPTGNFLHFQNAAANADIGKLDVSGNLSVSGSIAVISATVAGNIALGQGTAPGLVANNLQLIAPASVSASGEQFIFPGTAATGFIRWTNSANVLTGAFAAASGTGACANTVVTAVNDNAGPTCNPVTGPMFGTQLQNLALLSPNGSSGTPTFRAIAAADLPVINLNVGGGGGVTGTLPIANGGTNATTAAGGFNNLSPMTTAGDIIYGGTAGAGTRLAAGTATQLLHSGTTPSWSAVSLTADVTGVLSLANGGTNASSGLANTNGAVYSDGTKLVSTATGGAGTLCLISVNGAAPSFAGCAGSASTVWSSLSAPVADLSLSMSTFNTLFTHGIMTGTRNIMEWTDGASTSTGSVLNVHTNGSSTMKPVTLTAAGTANGVQMNTSGVLAAIGTGGITATSTTLSINTTSPLGGGGAFTASLTLTCATCVTSGASLTNNQLIVGSGGGQGSATLAAGTTKQILIAGSPPTYIDFSQIFYSPAADCVNAAAGSGWSTGATPAALCRAGTNNKNALLSPWGASDVAYFQIHLPKDWDTGSNPLLMLELTSTDATNGHTIIMQESIGCAKLDGSTTDDVAFNAARSLSTITLNGNANRTWEADLALNGTDMTGCSAPGIMWVKVSRTTDTATNVGVYGATITVPRLLTVQAN